MNFLLSIDTFLITTFKKIAEPFARVSLFIIYFWFGILKIIGTSPANPLVQALMEKTLPFMTFSQFIIGFSIYEMVIGISFLFPKLTRVSIILLAPHMVMTTLPLFMLPGLWQSFLTPTLEGQYIIKNLVIMATAIFIASRLSPVEKRK